MQSKISKLTPKTLNHLLKFAVAALLMCGHMFAQVLNVNAFTGSDPAAQINSCLSKLAAGSGGTCDARMYNGTQYMSQQINVLPGTVLLLPQMGAWVWDLRDGVSAGLMQYNGSSIVGSATGGGGNGMLLLPGSNSTNMLALYATDGSPNGGGSYTYASGFNALNMTYSGARFSHGLVYTRLLFDESRIERVTSVNEFGDAWHVYGVCCDTEFVQIQASSNYGPQGGTPMTVENAVGTEHGSSFSLSGTINAAGTGHPNLDIQDGNNQMDFPEVYMETNGSAADLTTAVVRVTTTSTNTPILRFRGGTVNLNSSKPCFSIPAAFSPLQGMENDGWCGPKYSNTVTLNASTFNNATITSGTATLSKITSNWFGYSAGAQNGQIGAGSVTFTPTVAGWYRIFSGRYLQGSVDIRASDPEQDVQANIQQGWYGVPANISILNTGLTYGLRRVVTKIATSSNNGDGAVYLDLYVADVSNPMPISVTFTGQGVAGSGIIPAPSLGSGPTQYSLATADMSDINSDSVNFPSLFTTGNIGANRFLGNLSTPVHSWDNCRTGQFWDDANFHYVCVATNTIKRVALSSF